MRKLLLTLSLGLVYHSSNAQTFYVQPSKKGYEEAVRQKMDYEGYKLVDNDTLADYKVDCLMQPYKGQKFKFIGCVRITNTKTGQEVGRTKEVKQRVTAFVGYNAGKAIFKDIAQDYLIDLLKLCK
jgi:hypothetical protein